MTLGGPDTASILDMCILGSTLSMRCHTRQRGLISTLDMMILGSSLS
jgi:hypothetical protein